MAGHVRFPGPPPRIIGRGVDQYLVELQDWLAKIHAYVGEAATQGFRDLTPLDVGVTADAGTAEEGWAAGLHVHRMGIIESLGDLLTHDGQDPIRLTVGADTFVLQADSAEPAGLKWTDPGGLIILTAGRFVYTDSAGRLVTGASFIADDSGSGDGVLTVRKTPSTAQNFLRMDGTLASGAAGQVDGVVISITGAGSANGVRAALTGNLLAGYTGNYLTWCVGGTNASAGTGAVADLYADGFDAAVFGQSVATTTNARVGVYGRSSGGSLNCGLVGRAIGAKAASQNIGVLGSAGNSSDKAIAGYFALQDGASFVSPNRTAALVADNGGFAAPIIEAYDNASLVFSIDDGGNVKLLRTITAAGTTGAQTINKPAGTVNFAAGAGSLVVTNNLVTANSIVLCVLRTNDATAVLGAVVPAAGSFTINMKTAPTAESSVGFLVLN